MTKSRIIVTRLLPRAQDFAQALETRRSLASAPELGPILAIAFVRKPVDHYRAKIDTTTTQPEHPWPRLARRGGRYAPSLALSVPYTGRQDTCEAPNPSPQTGATAIIDRLDAMLGELQAIQQLIAALINDVRELITSTNGHHSTANGTPIEQITKWWQIDDPFPSPEAAIDWAMQRGIFKARQHAENAYEKAKRDGQPKTASQMALLWRAEIKRRIDAKNGH